MVQIKRNTIWLHLCVESKRTNEQTTEIDSNTENKLVVAIGKGDKGTGKIGGDKEVQAFSYKMSKS